jgi:transposase
MSSGFAKARSNSTFHGSTRNGRPDNATAPTYGGASGPLVFAVRSGSSPNGPPVAAAPTKADAESLHRVPSARTIARLMTTGRDTLTKSETVTIAAIEGGVPLLVEAREVIAAFHAMIRKKAERELDPWLERARASLVASFANGVTKDKAAVTAAIASAWSNGQTEGQITKLKLVKRQMYGRAKLDLLEARLIGAG